MRTTSLSLLAALLSLTAACAPGDSVLTVTVTADPGLAAIDTLTATVSDTAGRTGTAQAKVGATIPPDYQLSLRFDSGVRGTVHVVLQGSDGAGTTLANGSGDVEVEPSRNQTLTIKLTSVKLPPKDAKLAFTVQPMNGLTKTALPAIKVSVLGLDDVPITDTNIPITLALGNNPTSSPLVGTLTVAATQGVATFTDLSLDLVGTGYTLTATASGVASATSAPFDIQASGFIPASAGLSGGVINDIVLDKSHPQTLYAATRDNGVWKTTDAGATWKRAAIGLPARASVDRMAIDPTNSTIVWAACGEQGIYKTTDAGNSWTQSTATPVHAGAYAAIAVDPSHPLDVYAANLKSVLHTANGGTTWVSIATNATYGAGPRSIAIHPTTGDVWVAQFGDGLAKLPYGGSTFVAANGATNTIPGLHPYMKCIAFDPFDPVYMYASGDISGNTVFTSSDGGANWLPAAASPANAPVRLAGFVGAGGATRMYGAVPELGVVSNPTAKNKFDYPSTGTPGAVAVAVDPGTAGVVYTATPTGVMRTLDSFNFTNRSDTLYGIPVLDLAVDPSGSGKVYLGTRNGVYRSTDSAQTWGKPISPAPGGVDIWAVAVAYGDEKNVFVGTSNWTFHSADFGGNFSAVSYGPTVQVINSLAASRSMTGRFYAGATGGQAYTIQNGDSQWSPAGAGLPAGSNVIKLVVHPTLAQTVLAVTNDAGVYKTSDGGATWLAAGTGLGSTLVTGIAVDPTDGNKVYVTTRDHGVWRSNDAGTSFASASVGVPDHATAISLDPAHPATIYVATDQGVYQSLDGGTTWKSYSAGLGSVDITTLAVDASSVVFAGTWDNGVWRTGTQ